jgi:hypothetical protein
MGVNSVIQFHTQVHTFLEVLWFFSLIDEASLKFSGKATLEGSLFCIAVIIQDGY